MTNTVHDDSTSPKAPGLFMLFGVLLLAYVALRGAWAWNSPPNEVESLTRHFGWVGWVMFAYILLSWRALTGMYVSPYAIFASFLFVFSLGQYSLWTFGVHSPLELGPQSYPLPLDALTLLRTQIASIALILSFHLGALLGGLRSRSRRNAVTLLTMPALTRSLLRVGVIVCAVTLPVTLLDSGDRLSNARLYGYSSIYYGGYEQGIISRYAGYMFLPSLIAIWIGSGRTRRAWLITASLFSPYATVNLLSGDRGSWIYALLLYMWMFYYSGEKRPSRWTVALGLSGSFFLLLVTSMIVDVRDKGGLATLNSDVVETAGTGYLARPFEWVFEMGKSANVLGALLQSGDPVSWQHGNTYLAAFSSMILPRMKILLGYPDYYLDSWLSQEQLGLSGYGMGFSLPAEAYLNGGVIAGCLALVFLGYALGRLTYLDRISVSQPGRLFVAVSSVSSLIFVVRGSLELNLRAWFYGTVVLLAFVVVHFKSSFSLVTQTSDRLFEAESGESIERESVVYGRGQRPHD